MDNGTHALILSAKVPLRLWAVWYRLGISDTYGRAPTVWGDWVSSQGLEFFERNPTGWGPNLHRNCGSNRAPEFCPCGSQCLRPEPIPAHRSMSQSGSERWRFGRLQRCRRSGNKTSYSEWRGCVHNLLGLKMTDSMGSQWVKSITTLWKPSESYTLQNQAIQ